MGVERVAKAIRKTRLVGKQGKTRGQVCEDGMRWSQESSQSVIETFSVRGQRSCVSRLESSM